MSPIYTIVLWGMLLHGAHIHTSRETPPTAAPRISLTEALWQAHDYTTKIPPLIEAHAEYFSPQYAALMADYQDLRNRAQQLDTSPDDLMVVYAYKLQLLQDINALRKALKDLQAHQSTTATYHNLVAACGQLPAYIDTVSHWHMSWQRGVRNFAEYIAQLQEQQQACARIIARGASVDPQQLAHKLQVLADSIEL